MTCAYCHSDKVARSHRRGAAERFMSLLFIYPYRCRECDKRVYTRSQTKMQDATSSWEKIRLQLWIFGIGLITCLTLVYFFIQERVPSGD